MRTIAHISDLHFGTHDPRITEDLLSYLESHAPDLVVISGDLTQRARQREFEAATHFLQRISPETIVVPGNHDVPLFNLFARFVSPLAKYDSFLKLRDGQSNFFRDEEMAVLGLNTARGFTHKNGRISVGQVRQIEDAFRSLPQHVLKVLVTHHPLDIPSGDQMVTLAGRWRRAKEAAMGAGVQVLLSGHYHRASMGIGAELKQGGALLSVHAGTALSTRTRGDGNTFNLLHLDRHRVIVRVLQWSAAGFADKQTRTFVADGPRWRRSKD